MMSNITNNSGGTENSLANTSNFHDQHSVDTPKEFVRNTRERRCQRKRSKLRSNIIPVTTSTTAVFGSSSLAKDEYPQTGGDQDQTANEAEQDGADLTRSIENLVHNFDKDIEINEGKSFFKYSSKSNKGRVASAVASLRSKCALTPTPSSATKTSAKFANSFNIQELRKKYENSMAAETTITPKNNAKSPKVKQLAALYNNKANSVAKDSPRTTAHNKTVPLTSKMAALSSPTYTSTPKCRPAKIESKFATYKTKLPSPKPSPFFKRKQLTKTPSISSLADLTAVNNESASNNNSTASFVAENVFSQLSVKDKVLLYNKFVKDVTKQNPKFSKEAALLESKMKKQIQKGEVVFEKQDSVKHLRASLEAKISPDKGVTATPKSRTKSSSKSPLDNSSKPNLEDSQDTLQGRTFTVILRPSPGATNRRAQAKKSGGKKDVTFSENVTVLEQALKRPQSMIRSPYCIEPLAPPKKIRRFRQEHLAPGAVFQNPRLEKLFYYWLKNKKGVTFDITAADSNNNMIEIVPKSPKDETLPPQAEQKTLEASVKDIEASEADDTNNGLAVINQTLDNENSLEKSVIEIELPLEDQQEQQQQPDVKALPTEGSDSGLNSTNKNTSEDSHTELNCHEVGNSIAKPLRKKKLRRNFMLDNEIISVAPKPKTSSTDSDSDYKANNAEVESLTLPRTTICDRLQSSTADKSSAERDENGKTIPTLDDASLRQMSPAPKTKTSFTLTVQSSSSVHLRNDFDDKKSAPADATDVSRSCPSLLETDLDSNIGLLKEKSASEQITDLIQPQLHEQQTRLMQSFTDKGFSMYSNGIDSPLRINIKTKYNNNKSEHKTDSLIISYKVNAQQQQQQQQAFTAQSGLEKLMPITNIATNNYSQQKVFGPAEDGPERNRLPSSLNESSFCSTTSVRNRSNFNLNASQPANTSQFWISSGEFTAAIAIHYYEAERLKLLYNIYAQKSLAAKAMNFGIDEQTFAAEHSPILDEIVKKLPQRNGCSQYWFSTDNVVIPFKGPQMSAEKIEKFFHYIREFMEETESLRFGIDGYEFSNSCQQTADDTFATTPTNCSPWTQIVSSPLKTSDLDHSDPDGEECEQSSTFASTGIVKEILRKFAANENKLTVAEMVKTLEEQKLQYEQNQMNWKKPPVTRIANESLRNFLKAGYKFGRPIPKTTAV